MTADHQAVHGGLHVADGEWNGGCRGVFVRGLIRDAGDGGERKSRRLNSSNTVTAYAAVSVTHCKGDRGRAELIGGTPDTDSSTLSLHDALPICIRHQARVG